ncbi:MAG: LysR family transcriptional regulator [Pseudomonadota bacterium]
MLNNLKSLGVFAKVAETGSFSKAAAALGISAPVVSQHITQLETQLDTALIYRSTRSLSLTDAGEKLAAHALKMIEAAEEGLDEIEEGAIEHSGRLTITAPSFLATPALTDVLIEFQAAHPKVDLRVIYSTRLENLIESGIDLAIRVGELQDSNLRAKKILDGYGSLYAAPAFLEAHGRIKTGAEIHRYEGKWIRPLNMSENCLFDKSGQKEPVPFKLTGGFETDGAEQIRQLALKGAGIAFLTHFYALRDLEDGRLEEILPDWHTAPMGVYAVWPHNTGQRSLTKLFVEHVMASKLVKHFK